MLAVSDMGPRGGVLAYFHTYVGLGHFFFWLKILNFDIFRGFSEKNILRYEDFVDIFWGNHTIGVVISMHFRVFS